MTIRIKPGGLFMLDPDGDEPFQVDWDSEHLTAGVGISTSTWIIVGRNGADNLEQHDDDIGALDSTQAWEPDDAGRVTRVYLTGATGIAIGQMYHVTNRIVTNTSPPMTKDRSFYVLIHRQ